MSGLLKLSSRPTPEPVTRMYVITCEANTGSYVGDALDFHHHATVDDEIRSMVANDGASILDGVLRFSHKRDPVVCEFERERGLIVGLEQPGAEPFVDFHRARNELLSEFLV
jgi:hypothetical protein